MASSESKGETKAPFVARVDSDPELADLQTRSFKLPAVVDNQTGWGPAAAVASLFFGGVPYAPFSKGDRLGRIADFTNTTSKFQGNAPQAAAASSTSTTATSTGGSGTGARTGGAARGGNSSSSAAAANSAFAYRHEEDEDSFSVVDNKPKQQKVFGARRKFRGGATGGAAAPSESGGWQQRGGGRGGRGGFGARGGRGGGRGGGNRWNANQWGEAPVVVRDPSCAITEEWKEVDEIEFTELSDETYAPLEVENVVEAGSVLAYNPGHDHLVPKTAKPLQRFDKHQHFTATTSEDPVLSRLIKEGAGNIYATDTILAVLMTSSKSVNSWDIIVRREGGNTYLDKRPTSRIDFLSVNENWNEITISEKESINSSLSLANEATYINHNFSQQVLVKDKEMKFDEENPFLGSLSKGQVAAAEGYRYRKWQLGDKINLVARCTVNAYQETKTDDRLFLCVRALNEFDSKLSGNVDWRQKLEAQTGAVLATEMKNNANKLSRWVAEAILSGAHELRLGFVTRTIASDPNKHSVLMVKSYSPLSFAKLLDIKVRNQWGSLKYILESLQKLDDGKYVLMKDPNKAALRVYSVPASFVDEEPVAAATR